MRCHGCKKELIEDANYCHHCGATVVRDEFDSKECGRWSWAGFFIGWPYLGFMNYKWWWLYLVIYWIALTFVLIPNIYLIILGGVLLAVPAVYLGMNGRAIAYKYSRWKNKKDYLRLQRNWDIAGFILLVLAFAGYYYISES